MPVFILSNPGNILPSLGLQLHFRKQLGQTQINYIRANIPTATQCYMQYIQ